MSIWQSVALGVVEGVTEFLPISSTGHLILAGKLLGIADTAFAKSFDIAIQLGAILSVVVLYFQKILADRTLWKKIAVAFVPTAFLGFIFYRLLKDFLLSNSQVVLWALFLGGVALIFFEIWYNKTSSKEPPKEITYKNAFVIGLAQSLAIIPGVSRAGATIVGGLLLGVGRKEIVEFSFLLAIPTMAAATGYDLLKSASEFSFAEFHVLAVGFIVSFLTALLAVKWLLQFIKRHDFIPFGAYRIILALVFWLLVTV